MICPICAKESMAKYRPFCSRRCADVDLGRWVTGHYAIPVEEGGDTGQVADVDDLTPPSRPQ